jgi:hypothetical protein
MKLATMIELWRFVMLCTGFGCGLRFAVLVGLRLDRTISEHYKEK